VPIWQYGWWHSGARAGPEERGSDLAAAHPV